MGSTGFERVEGADPFAGIDVGENSAPHFADLDDDGLPDLRRGRVRRQALLFPERGVARRARVREHDGEPFANVSVGYYSAPAPRTSTEMTTSTYSSGSAAGPLFIMKTRAARPRPGS